MKDIKKDFSDDIEKLKESLKNEISEKELKVLKTEVPDN